MAEDTVRSMDMVEHERTYKGFVKMTKWGVISTVVILVLMAVFLV